VTDTMTDVTNPRKTVPDSVAAQLIAQARAEGVNLVGPGQPVGGVDEAQELETALEAELDEHLGYEHGDREDWCRDGERAQRDKGQDGS